MDIYQLLTQDHNQLKPLLNQLVTLTEMNSDTKVVLQQIKNLLVPHSRAEEAVFYNALRAIDADKGKLRDSFREHMTAEALLNTLLALDTINVEWTAAAKKLREALLHHIHEEEIEIFSLARQVLLEGEAQQMALAFTQAKEKAKEQGNFKNTMDLIANMMPPRLRSKETHFAAF